MFWTFLCLRGNFGHFLHFMGVFWSYSSNRWYFDLFQAWGVLCSFSMFWGGTLVCFYVFGVISIIFLGFDGVYAFVRYQGCFGHFLCVYRGILFIFSIYGGYFGHI